MDHPGRIGLHAHAIPFFPMRLAGLLLAIDPTAREANELW